MESLKEVDSFDFCPKCARTNTISLLFADELLVFCKGNEDSIMHIRDQLRKFSLTSRLMPNEEKSIVYFGGIPVEEQNVLAQLLGMPIRSFPFRYLGVPLSHKKLSIFHCLPLVD